MASICRELGIVLRALYHGLGTGHCGMAHAQEAELHFIVSLTLAKAVLDQLSFAYHKTRICLPFPGL